MLFFCRQKNPPSCLPLPKHGRVLHPCHNHGEGSPSRALQREGNWLVLVGNFAGGQLETSKQRGSSIFLASVWPGPSSYHSEAHRTGTTSMQGKQETIRACC